MFAPFVPSTPRFGGVWKSRTDSNRFTGFRLAIETAEPGYFTPCQVAHAFQPAVSQVFNLHCFGGFGQSADCKSAIQQAKSLRYAARMLTRVRGLEYAGEAVRSFGRQEFTRLKRGVTETRQFESRVSRRIRQLGHLAGCWLMCFFITCSAIANPDVPIHFLRTPDAGLQPQVEVDSTGTVHLVYLRGDPKACNVIYARREPGRTEFSQGIRVNTEPGSAIAIGTVRGAQLALGRSNRVHVVWNGSQPATEPGAKGSPMLYSRLKADGRTFEPQRNLMTCTMNLDGGGSVAADQAGNVYVVWHAHSRSGPDDEMHRAVYLALSADDGKTFAPERQVNSATNGVCGCCGLKAAVDDAGRLAIIYRSADDRSNRDSMLLVSSDHGKSFEQLLLGTWHSTTCPMSTPGLIQAPDHSLLGTWETEGQVYRRLLDPRRLATSLPTSAAQGHPGNRKHPVVALNPAKGSHLLVAWVEGSGWEKGGSLAWECVDPQSHSSTTGSRPGVPVWGLAAVVPERDGSFTIIY